MGWLLTHQAGVVDAAQRVQVLHLLRPQADGCEHPMHVLVHGHHNQLAVHDFVPQTFLRGPAVEDGFRSVARSHKLSGAPIDILELVGASALVQLVVEEGGVKVDSRLSALCARYLSLLQQAQVEVDDLPMQSERGRPATHGVRRASSFSH